MTTTNKKIINLLLLVDMVIIVVCILLGDENWLYSSQVGFFSSALIISASMISYRRMVDNGVAVGAITVDIDRDDFDKLDDPYDLYSDDIEEEEKSTPKEKSRSIGQIAKDSKPAFSFFRLGAYVILVLGFLFLNRHDYLHIASYLISLSFPPFIIVFILLSKKGDNSE